MLNLFLRDIYNEGRVLKDGIVLRGMIYGSKHYRREMRGVQVPHGSYVNVCGSDLIRNEAGEFVVLEDNLRPCPLGVSYMLANGVVVRRALPNVYQAARVKPIEHYPQTLLSTLKSLVPFHEDVSIAVLTPGVFNSAYFEHAFLARQMGVELVEGRDVLVNDNVVYARTTSGLKRIDVIYRRVDDDFIDPLIFREDLLGVPGLFNAYRAGNVQIANALGTGVADDKAVYAYVPRLIRYYLSEEPILHNVETFLCREEKSPSHVLANLDKLVVKAVGESGGYGMPVGPACQPERARCLAEKIKADPENYIAQPTIQLSTAPTFIGGGVPVTQALGEFMAEKSLIRPPGDALNALKHLNKTLRLSFRLCGP